MNRKLTIKEFIQKANQTHNNKYDYSESNYISARAKITIICHIHGKFEQVTSSHLRGSGCSECAVEDKKFTQKEFINKANKIHDSKYDYSKVIYISSKQKVVIICAIHGEFEQNVSDHLSGRGCPSCAGLRKLTIKQWIEKANLKHDDLYDYSLSEYINSRSKIEIICKKHNSSFWQEASSHLAGKGCPNCIESKGEEKIKDFLDLKDIRYLQQYRFDDCKDIRPLPFDFYLPDFNICIEYDGQQHYIPTSWSSDQSEEAKLSNLKDTQSRDQIKTQYCLDNKIKLIRIPYWKFKNIEELLNLN